MNLAENNRTLLIRGQKVLLDRDLADIYQSNAGAINRNMKSNIEQFTENKHYFQLNQAEKEELIHTVHRFKTLKHSNNLPYAYTLKGSLKIAFYMRSEVAKQVSDYIIDVFADNLISQDNTIASITIQMLSDKIENLQKNFDFRMKVSAETVEFLKEKLEILEAQISRGEDIGF